MQHDIALPADIKLLIDTFYAKVQADEVLGHVFNDVARVDWPQHLPTMYAFWEFLLLGNADASRGIPSRSTLPCIKNTPLPPNILTVGSPCFRPPWTNSSPARKPKMPSSGPSPLPLPGSLSLMVRLPLNNPF